MKKSLLLLLVASFAFVACSDYENVLKSTDYNVRYEAAKQYYFDGHYGQASTLFMDLIAGAKGTDRAEEALFLLGMSSYKDKAYDAAAGYFKKYYQTYPKGTYALAARYMSGLSLYENTPEPRLDQTDTYKAITEFKELADAYPKSSYAKEAMKRIFELQDKLIDKNTQRPNSIMIWARISAIAPMVAAITKLASSPRRMPSTTILILREKRTSPF